MAMSNARNSEMDRELGDDYSDLQQRDDQGTMRLKQLREDLQMEQRLRARRRQTERDELLQRYAEDIEFIKRKRETIERRMARKDLEQISEYEMKAMRHELAALEKDMRLLVRRRQSEEEEFQRSVEEDTKYVQRQMVAIDREERYIRRQQQKEEEEVLEQQRRRQQSLQTQQLEEKLEESQLHRLNLSDSKREEAKAQSEQEIARRTLNPDTNKGQSSQRSGMSDMTDTELQTQLQSLMKELSKRNVKDTSLETGVQTSENIADIEDNSKSLTGANRTEKFERVERATTLNTDGAKNDYDDGNTTKLKTEYQTIDRVDTTRYSFDTSDVKDRKYTSSENVNTYHGNIKATQQIEQGRDVTETRPSMIKLIDQEIDELDKRLTQLREESFKYKYGQPMERSVHFEKDSISDTSQTERKLEGTYLDPKDMEREIKYDMRSTPKISEVKIGNDRQRYYDDNYDRTKEDAKYRYGMDDFERRNERPEGDGKLSEKPFQIRFVETYDRNEADVPRQRTENGNMANKDTVVEKEIRHQ